MEDLKAFLNKVWDILVQHAGAWEDDREAFVIVATDRAYRCLEYRFVGKLGFGGKVWLWNKPHVYINCYREDETPERRKIMTATNRALKQLKQPQEVR